MMRKEGTVPLRPCRKNRAIEAQPTVGEDV